MGLQSESLGQSSSKSGPWRKVSLIIATAEFSFYEFPVLL